MPTTVTCSSAARGPVRASWPRSPRSWNAACGSRSTRRRAPCATRAGALPGLPLSAAPGRPDRRPVVGKDGTAAGGDHQGDDALELGTVHHRLHGRTEPLPDRVDGTLPAVL